MSYEIRTPRSGLSADKVFVSAGGEGKRIYASPLARRRARELNIDYTALSGSGPKGRVIEKDVLTEKAREEAARAAAPACRTAEDFNIGSAGLRRRVLAQDIYGYLENSREKPSDGERREVSEAMSGMRRAIAKNMLGSHLTSPSVTINSDVDMSAAGELRAQLKANGIKVSYTDVLVKLVSMALLEHPDLNCSIKDESIVYKHYVNMGVAVALNDGLVVPNIKNSDRKSLAEISAELKKLAALAREGGLGMDDMRGGTFTITNLGMYGIDSFTPIINQPETAILGVTAIKEKALAIDGKLAIRPVMTLCLTFDHRAVDGAAAARFLQRVKELLERPALTLA